ncbi:MAG: DUF192 domain-containing protein [Spirochaetaceae bacterium]|nr:DUF192 domain-containing protein [Spirochaetaceae bacterium]
MFDAAKNSGLWAKRGKPLVLLVLFVLGCTAVDSGNRSGSGKAQRGLETRVLSIGEAGARIEAELARTGPERQTGLMYRTELQDGRGMLFVFDRDEVLSFWMKNTLIPLSIAFITYDGVILEIRNMYPGDLRSIQSSRSVRYALETPQGWFERAGIRAGDRVDLGDLQG